MNTEFHYYITGILAWKAGFSEEESSIIAYSSQFVDDNSNVFTVGDYSNYISQTKNILKPRKTLMRIYSTFHFIPGDPMAESARRKDGKMHILNTTPNSKLSQEVMHKAFNSSKEGRLYRIGIASHTYTDTWAHQNFVGFNDSFNGFDLNPIPNIGHSDAILDPDVVCKDWVDERLLYEVVSNNDRFILAAEHLFYKYVNYLESNAEWEPVKRVLLAIMGIDNKRKRMALYSTLVPWLLPYNKDYWFEKAIGCNVKGLRDFKSNLLSSLAMWKDDYFWKEEDTDWFKFQESIKGHQKEMLPKINDIYKLMGVDIKLF